jgi:hypothetical protein
VDLMNKRTFEEWAQRTGCYVYMQLRTINQPVLLSLDKPKMTNFGLVSETVLAEISNICQQPEYEWSDDMFITPKIPIIKRYSLYDWVKWLGIPVMVELVKNTVQTNFEHLEYFVLCGIGRTNITQFVIRSN